MDYKILELYQSLGFDLVPIVSNGKVPIEMNWTNKEHKDINEWKRWLVDGLNIGLKCGKCSNVTVLDIDQKIIPQELAEILNKYPTLSQITSKGYHYIYHYTDKLPKTRIDDLKVDIETDGGQVVITPSIVDGVERQLLIEPIVDFPEELLNYLSPKVTIRNLQSFSEKLKEDLNTENFNLNIIEEGSRNTFLIHLGGILRKEMNINQTAYTLNIVNKHFCKPSLPLRELDNIVSSLDKYLCFDETELAVKILNYMKIVEEASSMDIREALGEKGSEGKQRIEKAIKYLVKEGFLFKKRRIYHLIRKATWETKLIDFGKIIDFKLPYLNRFAIIRDSDMIVIGAKTGYGKTHIGLNIIKQLVNQGKIPHYISLESGARFIDIALKLGLKEGDFKWAVHFSPQDIELEENAITIIDWLLPDDYAQSVHAETPIFIKNNDKISIIPIRDLDVYHQYNNLFIWTEKGWSKVKNIIKKKSNKKMYVLVTKTSIIELTEDHSLVIKNKEVSPQTLTIGDRIELIEFPSFGNDVINVDNDWAWLNGFFSAEGTILYYKFKDRKNPRMSNFRLYNNNLTYLEKAQKILNKIGIESKIKKYNSTGKCYTLYSTFIPLSSLFHKWHINKDKTKKVPEFMFKVNISAKEEYLRGLFYGDGHIYENGIIGYSSTDKTLFTGVCKLLKDLDIDYTVSYRMFNGNQKTSYGLRTNKTKTNRPNDVIKFIYTYQNKKDYVYDIETENHHFCSGGGEQVLCHNTDKLYKYFAEQLVKKNGILIIFAQLMQNGEFFAKNMIDLFPALVAKFLYEDENGENSYFQLTKVREPKEKIKYNKILCTYNFSTKELNERTE